MDKTTLWIKCDRLAYLFSLSVVDMPPAMTAEENSLCAELYTEIGERGSHKLYMRGQKIREDRQRMQKGDQ